jgi:hypothetical protein
MWQRRDWQMSRGKRVTRLAELRAATASATPVVPIAEAPLLHCREPERRRRGKKEGVGRPGRRGEETRSRRRRGFRRYAKARVRVSKVRGASVRAEAHGHPGPTRENENGASGAAGPLRRLPPRPLSGPVPGARLLCPLWTARLVRPAAGASRPSSGYPSFSSSRSSSGPTTLTSCPSATVSTEPTSARSLATPRRPPPSPLSIYLASMRHISALVYARTPQCTHSASRPLRPYRVLSLLARAYECAV